MLAVSHTSEHAVKEWLGRFRATRHPTGTEPSRMRPDTVQFVKRRETPFGQMLFVTCEAEGGYGGTERWRWTVEAPRGERGRWVAYGVSGASGLVSRRSRPWADLGGHWGPAGFRASGTVDDAGAGIASVRLTDLHGRSFEDRVEAEVVLFSSDEPVAMPMRLELFDREGRVVHSDEWGFVDE